MIRICLGAIAEPVKQPPSSTANKSEDESESETSTTLSPTGRSKGKGKAKARAKKKGEKKYRVLPCLSDPLSSRMIENHRDVLHSMAPVAPKRDEILGRLVDRSLLPDDVIARVPKKTPPDSS